ncbi:hypothetical protein O181_113773 [Austropuccinia psidii MF-1]|uniref:Uncharacterized protein n=1 Tax=Austropuccinia psidii MF-1 TaxID=1389203 RepID=A0A9Q3K347_9BASI|nr:hypothetical protein [Austropuccinia psidii MF-1]
MYCSIPNKLIKLKPKEAGRSWSPVEESRLNSQSTGLNPTVELAWTMDSTASTTCILGQYHRGESRKRPKGINHPNRFNSKYWKR